MSDRDERAGGEVQRYDVVIYPQPRGILIANLERAYRDNGANVDADDHLAALAAKDAELRKAREESERLRDATGDRECMVHLYYADAVRVWSVATSRELAAMGQGALDRLNQEIDRAGRVISKLKAQGGAND